MAYLATFLLDSRLPALDGETEQQEKWSGRENDEKERDTAAWYPYPTPHLLADLLAKQNMLINNN